MGNSCRAVVYVGDQKMVVYDHEKIIRKFDISTSSLGVGQEFGSFKTPLGKHIIRARIGDGKPINAVFVSRRFTGEIYSPELATKYPDRDWILTRILWLSGLERGLNRLGSVDTMRRYVYIHGTPDSEQMGVVGSRGCVRINNKDMLELFPLTYVGMRVDILEGTE